MIPLQNFRQNIFMTHSGQPGGRELNHGH